MRGAYHNYMKQKGTPPSLKSEAVEEAAAQHAEECELRLARIQNGKHPEYQNGHPKDAEKGRSKT